MSLIGLGPQSSILGEHEDLGKRPIDTLFDWNESFYNYKNCESFTTFIEDQKKLMVENNYMNVESLCINLSEDQYEALDVVKEHSQLNLADAFKGPLHMIIQGTAGTGKSALIYKIMQFGSLYFHEFSSQPVRVLAYTGVAAFNIKGETIHSLLMLPISKGGFVDLAGQAAKLLQEDLNGVDILLSFTY